MGEFHRLPARRYVHVRVCFLAVFLAGSAPWASRAGSVENVLIVVADDLGVEMVPAYGIGTDLPHLPVIESLAQQGVRFENAYAQAVCSPTRACIQTGRYPFRTGIGDSVHDNTAFVLRSEEITLPEMLDIGTGSAVAHAFFGKWHLHTAHIGGATAPNDAGWSHFSGSLDNLSSRVSDSFYNWQKIVDGSATLSTKYATTDVVDSALAWLTAAPEPWASVVAFHAPHSPFHEPPFGLYTEDLSSVTSPSENPRPYYKAMAEAMDSEFGRLLASLDPAVLARTNVLFLADNGTPGTVVAPPFAQGKSKGTVYEGGVRVPMIVTGPRVHSPGGVSTAFVHAVDLFATVAEIEGVDLGPIMESTPFDSKSLLPHLADPSATSSRANAFSEKFTPNKDGGVSPPEFLCQEDLGFGGPGDATLSVCGEPLFPLHTATGVFENGVPAAPGFMIVSLLYDPTEVMGGMVIPAPYFAIVPIKLDGTGGFSFLVPGGPVVASGPLHCQVASSNSGLPLGWELSNIVRARFYDDPISHRVIRDADGMKLRRFRKVKKDVTVQVVSLYDLVSDPWETHDLLVNGPGGLTPEQSIAYHELLVKLDDLLATGPDP